jgi:prefoldin subunit 5
VRCSSQYSKSEDTAGSESAQRLQTLQKQKKQIESQIEMLRSKEGVLKEVLVAFAGSDKFDFSGGIDSYDQKKLEVRVKREELEEELAELEKKIREIGLDTMVYSEHQVTGSTNPCQYHLMGRNCQG